ncbi:SDR family oxidoreductase [Paraperlucidibaca wandonensis]|jgi:NAD(P)-dependent dehydrogenase (short-subunit alcohol dehydrogenase family)|uniref:SDR family oxidoreductase n=1 Tax=Paraperlucidibaca wandonensis TaxID=1268273 RepID=A0ABW3HH76_9GAMM|nr:SDR family oxidoreductase [Paraperlucidibaca sp.]|tara:strand:+ start:8231 stop:9094 length:864 start_codon:yes stop_codon:yes gene_type:complete
MTSPRNALVGKVIAITGGARGIGLAIAEALTAQGARVSIGDIDLELAQREAKRIGAHAGRLDVRERESFAQFIAETEAALGSLYGLINNAGIMPMGYFLDEDPALADAQIDINFRGVIHGMQVALPKLLERQSGHIVNIASLAGRFALPGSAIYCGTKFAVVGMTESVAGEYRDSGVEFTCIMPSKVLTELTAGTDKAASIIPAVTPEQVADAVVASLIKPRLMVAVPDYLQVAHRAYTLIPSWLQLRGRRLIDDTRILNELDHEAHAGYEQRINLLKRKSKVSKVG